MIPAIGPLEADSSAERAVYYLLREALDERFVVIHSVPWLASAVKGLDPRAAPTGQVDFLILHPDLGLLVLEVKGGQYRVNGSVFVHISSQREHDVVTQTRRNAHGLAKWLGSEPTLRRRIGYGVLFPDSDFSQAVISPALVDLSADAASIYVDRGQVHELGSRITQIMEYWKVKLAMPALGKHRMTQILAFLCPAFDGSPTWASRALYDQRWWLRLTPEQAAVVETAMTQNRLVVTGWPGTGKTVVAIELARRMASTGKRVLFVTFNARLAEHVAHQLAALEDACMVVTWHKLCFNARRVLKGRPDN